MYWWVLPGLAEASDTLKTNKQKINKKTQNQKNLTLGQYIKHAEEY